MKVCELLKTKRQWCQHAFALDHDRNAVSADSPLACKWCLWGAVHACYETKESRDRAVAKLRDAIKATVHRLHGVISFNDSMDWKDVKEVLRKANV